MLAPTPKSPEAEKINSSPSQPNVLVGIVTYNRAQILPKAIESAFAQTHPDTKVVILDNGSDDGTSDLQQKYPAADWVRSPTASRYLDARNCLMAMPADYFLSLDDDAWFLNGDEISIAVEYLEKHKRVGAVAFDILDPGRPNAVPRTEGRPTSSFTGCGHLLRVESIREIGLYEPTIDFYGAEEKDLCVRLLDRGWEVHVLPGVHVWHDRSPIGRDQPAQHRSGVCNDLVFALRRCPLPLLLVAFPLKVVNHLRFSFRHRLVKPCFSGLGMFFRNFPKVLQSREPVRRRTFEEFLRRGHSEA